MSTIARSADVDDLSPPQWVMRFQNDEADPESHHLDNLDAFFLLPPVAFAVPQLVVSVAFPPLVVLLLLSLVYRQLTVAI